MKAARKSEKSGPSPVRAREATALLRADHQAVSKLFAEFEKTEAPAKRRTLAAEICSELTVHAQIEEELFYPAVQEALQDDELVPEAIVEHATLKDLIAQIEGAAVDEMFNARVKVLSEYVKHHVKEEQNEIFPKARESSLDMTELGAKLAERKAELLAERS